MSAALSVGAFTPSGEPVIRREFQCTTFLEGNHNKLWRVEAYADGPLSGYSNLKVVITFGRVGIPEEKLQRRVKEMSEDGLEKLIYSKLNKGTEAESYREIELHRPQVVMKSVANDPKSQALHPSVIETVDWIFREAGEDINSFLRGGSAALNHMGLPQVEKGRRQLQVVQRRKAEWEASQTPSAFDVLASSVEEYYRIIQSKLPARPDAREVVLDFVRDMYSQEARLDQLEAALATMVIQQDHPAFSRYDALGAKIERMSWHADEHKRVMSMVNSTMVHNYKLKVNDIFSVEIPAERKRYERSKRGKDKVELLFHGTRGPFARHILKTGLKVPKSPATGWMLGPGIYFANKASKSTNYCKVQNAGAPGMLFLADVALGKQHLAKGAMNALPRGFDSVYGKQGHTRWAGGPLKFDEFVIYDESQATLRYLVSFDSAPIWRK